MQTMALPQQTAIDTAVRHLITNYSPKGNKVGWLMMASILVEAWDLYSIAFVLIFIREQYNPDPFMLGLAAAGTQGGALIGVLRDGDREEDDVQRPVRERASGPRGEALVARAYFLVDGDGRHQPSLLKRRTLSASIGITRMNRNTAIALPNPKSLTPPNDWRHI